MKNAANKFSLNCLIIIIFSTRTNFNKLKCHLRWPQQQYQLLNSGCSSISWASSAYEWWWSLFVQKLYDVKIQTCAQNLQFLFANSVFIFSIRFAFSSFIFAVAIWFSCKLKCNIFPFFLHWLSKTNGFKDVSSMFAMSKMTHSLTVVGANGIKYGKRSQNIFPFIRSEFNFRQPSGKSWFGRLAGWMDGWLADCRWW